MLEMNAGFDNRKNMEKFPYADHGLEVFVFFHEQLRLVLNG